MQTAGEGRRTRRALPVWAGLAIGFAGLTFHNLREFPVSVLWRGDTLILSGIALALALWWWRSPGRTSRAFLLGWGYLHLVGGGLIVGGGLPSLITDIMGGTPAYDLAHHFSHWVYGLLHVPLVWVTHRSRAGPPRTPRPS